jgi:4-amino-4-deoxychorismate lyase
MWRTRYEHSSVGGYARRVTEGIVVIPGSGTPEPDDYGDGVFETLHLRPGGPWLLAEHLDRLARSAARLELELPPAETLVTLALEAASRWTGPEGALRIICRRGFTYYATVGPVSPTAIRQRRSGIEVRTADLGVSVRRPPWSLSGAKTLSYAENLAARRWAGHQGADDLIWVSTEGYVLEAPTAGVVWLTGDTLCTVPPAATGILPGITAAHLLANAPGLRGEERMIGRDELAEADAIWLTSSLRGLAEVVTLDGQSRKPSTWTAEFLDALGFPR